MKKLGLFIALFSMMILTSCEKEDKTPVEDRIIGTWNAERVITVDFFGVDLPFITSKGKMTFNEDGIGLDEMKDVMGVFEYEEYEEEEEEEEFIFTWFINSNNELVIDSLVVLSNIVNESSKLEFTGTMELENDQEENDQEEYDEEEYDDMNMEDDMDFGLETTEAKITLKLSK